MTPSSSNRRSMFSAGFGRYHLFRFLAWCATLLLLVSTGSAHAVCAADASGTAGQIASKTSFNEYFFGNGPPNFLEVYSTSNAFPASWQGWSIDVYSGVNARTTYPLTNSTATACTVSNKTWLTANVPKPGLRQQNALVLLKNADGAFVDAFVFDNSSPPAPWPGAAASSWFPNLADPVLGCPALAQALEDQADVSGTTPKQKNMLVLSSYGNKDMARDPDGGPIWDLTSNTGAGTTYTQCVSNNANFTKTVDNATPTPGSTVTFTLNMANTGSSAMSGVQITDWLPADLVYISSTPSNPADPPVTTDSAGPGGVPTQVFWAPADIPAGTISKLYIKMDIPENAVPGTEYVNTAQTTAGLTSNQTDYANITIGSLNTPSFAISVSPSTSTTCTPALLGPKVTITAMSAANGGGTPLTTYNGTVTLTASSPTAKWYDASGTALSGNTATLSNGTISLYLENRFAETFTVSALDAVYANPEVMQGSSGDITFTGSSTGMTLIDSDMLSPTYGAVAGRPHAVLATISNCGTTSSTTGLFSGTAYYIPGLNHPVGAASPTINPTSSSCPGSVSLPLNSSGAPITLDFSAGRSTFYLCSTDVGQYALKITLSGVPSGTSTVTGTSTNFTVRPFAITATGFTKGATSNPAGAGVFTKAGSAFSGQLRALRWWPSADAETDGGGIQRGNGIPDAGITASGLVGASPGVTASFNGTTNNAGVVSLVPALPPADLANYSVGMLTPSSATLTSGAVTLTDGLSYSEVGNFRIGETGISTAYGVTNYLAAVGVNVPILSDVIGRITPDHFVVTAPPSPTQPITRRPGCTPDSVFTYMDETFNLRFVVTAYSESNTVTRNYKGTYAFLNPTTALWPSSSLGQNNSFGLGAFESGAAGATDFSGRMSWNTASGTWADGVIAIETSVSFARAAVLDGPFETLALGIAPRDGDGVAVKPAALTLGGNRVPIEASKLRFGRLKLFNSSVAGQSNMAMPVQAQFWSGKSWVLNSDDSCTLMSSGAVLASNYVDAKSAATSAWPVSVVGDTQITNGVGAIQITKPTGAVGTVDLCADLAADPASGVTCAATPAGRPYLQGRWAPGTTFGNDPRGRATFGIYQPETRRTIHIRERF